MSRPVLLVSACLLGEPVRYDGASRPSPWVIELGDRFDLIPVCPETGCGMGVPRPPVVLTGDQADPRVAERDTGRDAAGPLRGWIDAFAAALPADLAGYVGKARSPSCGVEDAPYQDANGGITSLDGLLTAALRRRFPRLRIATEEVGWEDGK